MPDKNKIILGTNDDTYIAADDAGNIVLQHEQGQRVALTNSSIEPATDETLDLGSPTNKFKDLYLSSDSIFIGNTKLSSDPATGALSTVVADEQGQFTAPAAAIGGGGGKAYDWKGSSTNIAASDPRNILNINSLSSMEEMYQAMAIQGNNSTGPLEVFWGNFWGNPDTTQYTSGPSMSMAVSNANHYDYTTLFITDENGDDLSKFLVDYMDEENLPIVNFDFTISARLEVKDPVKAAQIPYFQAGQHNNLTDVTSVPLWTMTQNYMYAFKTVVTGHPSGYGLKGHARGIMMGTMADGGINYNSSGAPSKVSLEMIGGSYGTLGASVFDGTYYQNNHALIGDKLALNIDIKLLMPSYRMVSTDSNAGNAGYFDLQDGIVFDMLVNIK
jgi:hypothetical protein